jgi:hypothetical protein
MAFCTDTNYSDTILAAILQIYVTLKNAVLRDDTMLSARYLSTLPPSSYNEGPCSRLFNKKKTIGHHILKTVRFTVTTILG